MKLSLEQDMSVGNWYWIVAHEDDGTVIFDQSAGIGGTRSDLYGLADKIVGEESREFARFGIIYPKGYGAESAIIYSASKGNKRKVEGYLVPVNDAWLFARKWHESFPRIEEEEEK